MHVCARVYVHVCVCVPPSLGLMVDERSKGAKRMKIILITLNCCPTTIIIVWQKKFKGRTRDLVSGVGKNAFMFCKWLRKQLQLFGNCDYCVGIVGGGHRKEWWERMNFNRTLLDVNPGSNTSPVPWTSLVNKPFTYIIGIIINISLIKSFGKLIFTYSCLSKMHVELFHSLL